MTAHLSPTPTLYVVQRRSPAGTTTSTNLNVEQAAELLNVDVAELEWSIEEFGRCDVDDGDDKLTAVAVGDEERLAD